MWWNLPATVNEVPDTEKLPSLGDRLSVYVNEVPASESEQPKLDITAVPTPEMFVNTNLHVLPIWRNSKKT